MEKKQNVPALRFQGFSGEWKRKTLGDFGNVAMNRRIFKEQTSETGEIPFYKIGTFGKEPDAYISRQLFEEYKAKYPYPDVGDILLSAAGSIGKTVEYTGKDEYFQDSNIVWLKHDERLDNPFLKYFYSKVKWGTLEGGTVKRLYNKILLETEIVLPEIIEQKKIGKFFASYDRMIAHQEGKIRKLQQFRQAMLTKLFPREGAAEPELRFRGFSGKWKRCQLGDVATFINGRAYARDELLSTGKYKVLRVGNFYTNDKWYYSNLELGEKYYAHKGDLLYTWSATFGPHIWDGDTVIYHYHIWKVELSEYLDKLFALQLLELDRDALLSDTNGSTMIHITMSDMKNRWITISENIEEQKLIGLFFYRLNLFISLQQKKLERMQRLKAALLEKLFV